MTLQVLVAGATGALGQHVTRELIGRGHRVRALVRRTPLPEDLGERVSSHRADALDASQLTGVCEGVDVVFSCLGASVSPGMSGGRRSFLRLDTPANLNLVRAARDHGVTRFVYVSVAGDEGFARHRYIRAHELVVEAIRAEGFQSTVVRPPGFFSAFAEVLDLARKGSVPLIGDGSAKTNPIHDADLASVCADAIEGERPDEIVVGGPETLSRRRIAEMALEALGKPVRVRTVPAGLVRALAPMIRPLNPRVADITAFYADVSTRDLVVPSYGARTLGDYFQTLALG